MSAPLTHSVKQRPSGEKLSCGRRRLVHEEFSKMESWLRVTASRTSTDWCFATAMNLLQGDHTASHKSSPKVAVATTRSHESGIP